MYALSRMKFCSVCDNMLYIRIGDAGATMLYTCKHCGFGIKAEETASKSCVLETNYSDDHSMYRQYASDLIKHDPTLPRVSNIPCENPACSRKEGAPHEVIFVKYDPVKLKYMYFCCHCESFWKPGQQQQAKPREEEVEAPSS